VALIREELIFVGAAQRLDGLGSRGYYSTKPYIRVVLDGETVNMSAAVARRLAKGLTTYARLIDPPKQRKTKP
jgi:hypothetical protein